MLVSIKEQNCGCEDFKEVKVAFGDLDNCQLKCPFCFTIEQKSSTQRLSELQNSDISKIQFIRFTGGEPLLRQGQIDGIINQLQLIEGRGMPSLKLIIIQTNAISVTDNNIDGFFESRLPILFEVSFKGTNIREYQYLTYKNPIDRTQAETIMQKQISGYEILSKKCQGVKNISVLTRLGIFHSSILSPKFKLIYPESRELMFNPNQWHSAFRTMFSNQISLWGNRFYRKIIVEKIKTEGDGSRPMGKRYRRIIDNLISQGLMEELKSSLPNIFQKHYIYKRGNEIYMNASSKLVQS